MEGDTCTFFCGLVLLILFGKLAKPTTSKVYRPAIPDIGQKAMLFNPEGKDVPVAVTEAAYEAERKAIYAGDKQGLVNLMLTLQLFTAPNKTVVLIIDSDSHRRKVRIISTWGEQEGLAGWVPDEFIYPWN